MHNETNRTSKNDEKNREPTLFNPLAWGILFFSFWISLQTIPKSTPVIQGMSWFFLGISVVLWFSIFLKNLQDLLIKPGLRGFFLPLLFFVSLLALAITLTQSWTLLQGVALYVSIIAGILWFVAYILILVRFAAGKIGRMVGIVISVVIIGIGIYTLVTSDIVAGIVLVGLGIASMLIAIFRPPIWHRFPFL